MPVSNMPCPKCKQDQLFHSTPLGKELIGACGHKIKIVPDKPIDKSVWNNRKRKK